MKFVVSGGSGVLGGELIRLLQENCQETRRFDRASLSPENLDAQIRGFDVFVHCAANTDLRNCEREPDKCWADNWLLTEKIARACARNGVQMVYISSTGVYGDWKSEEYREYDSALPVSTHHRSKLKGEESVYGLSCSSIVVRTGWIFGGRSDAKKNFVAHRIRELSSAASGPGYLFANPVQMGNPTSALHVAKSILRLVDANATGIYNCVMAGTASRFEYIREIAAAIDTKVKVIPDPEMFTNSTPRVSMNESAINWRLVQEGFEELPAWQESLHRYIHEEFRR